jgi:hypothetical protein
LQGALPAVVLPRGIEFTWARPAPLALPVATPDRQATSERLWDQIRAAEGGGGLDAVISYCFTSDVDPALIERTIELGVPWINFFCDSTYAFDRVEGLARVTSLNWFPERAATSLYRAVGRPMLCRPYAVNPAALPEATCQSATYALGFLGASSGNRVLRLAELRLFACATEVRGDGWTAADTAPESPERGAGRALADLRTRGRLTERVLARVLKPLVRGRARPLAEEEVAPFLSSCRMVLGLNEGRDIRGDYQSYLKLRDVEFPGYGCCYLTQHNDDLEDAFDVGRDVLTFRHAVEAASLVRWAVGHPTGARAIGQAGRQRVFSEHTWVARLHELVGVL